MSGAADARPGDAASDARQPDAAPGARQRDVAPDARERRQRRRPRWQPAALGVLVVLVLAALFLAGTRLPGILTPDAAAPLPTPSATPTPTPAPTPVPTSTSGPQLAGTFEWFQLRGGECIAPFTSAWQQRFTVVDCGAPHGGQAVSSGSLGADPALGYPGQAAIAENLNLLCQQPGSYDRAILGAYPDIVWQASYPVTDAQWQAGQRNFYCFVSRSSSLPITGDFAVPASTG